MAKKSNLELVEVTESPSRDAAEERRKQRLEKLNRAPAYQSDWHMTENLTPICSIFNAILTLREAAELQGCFRLNKWTQQIEILDGFTWEPLQDHHETLVQIDLQALGLRRITKNTVSDAIKAVAKENAFDPVAAWIESLEWDGVSRL